MRYPDAKFQEEKDINRLGEIAAELEQLKNKLYDSITGVTEIDGLLDSSVNFLAIGLQAITAASSKMETAWELVAPR